jgi:hypothetical protein
MSGEERNKDLNMGIEVEETSSSSHGEEIDPKILDLAMKIAENMFLKMKEEEHKKKLEEEARAKADLEAKKKAEEELREKGRKGMELNEELLESLVTKVMKKMNIESSSTKHDSKSNEYQRIMIIIAIFSLTSLPHPSKSFQPLVS